MALRNKGKHLGELLKYQLSSAQGVVDTRGMGLLWAIETNKPSSLAQDYIKIGHAEGINLYPCRSSGADGKALVFFIIPPLVITEEEIQVMVNKLYKVLDIAHENTNRLIYIAGMNVNSYIEDHLRINEEVDSLKKLITK
ncbi:aminotransferase class III-fold pyridoxal phosphate-dependent enzyme [Vibrio sp. PP-XX7]